MGDKVKRKPRKVPKNVPPPSDEDSELEQVINSIKTIINFRIQGCFHE